MKSDEGEGDSWETPSLEWIHEVRRRRQVERKGQPPRRLSREEAEKLAERFGLRLVRKIREDPGNVIAGR